MEKKETKIIDEFLTDSECDYLINFYKKNENFAYSFRDVFPLNLNDFSEQNDSLKFLIDKLNNEAFKINNSKIDWFEIVKWPKGSYQPLHLDNASTETTLSSITYLNDNYEGGYTYYKNDLIIKPVKKRSLFFDGKYYEHGVKKVTKNTRFVVAAWYKINN